MGKSLNTYRQKVIDDHRDRVRAVVYAACPSFGTVSSVGPNKIGGGIDTSTCIAIGEDFPVEGDQKTVDLPRSEVYEKTERGILFGAVSVGMNLEERIRTAIRDHGADGIQVIVGEEPTVEWTGSEYKVTAVFGVMNRKTGRIT